MAISSSRHRASGVWRWRVGSVHSAPHRETPYGVLGMECRMECLFALLIESLRHAYHVLSGVRL